MGPAQRRRTSTFKYNDAMHAAMKARSRSKNKDGDTDTESEAPLSPKSQSQYSVQSPSSRPGYRPGSALVLSKQLPQGDMPGEWAANDLESLDTRFTRSTSMSSTFS